MVIFDTNIVIDHVRLQNKGKPSCLEQFLEQNPHEIIAISIVSIQEFYAGRSTRDSMQEDYLLGVISPFTILPYTYEISQQAGEITRELENPIQFPDAIIAA